jgi:beta-ribofuranosylaminobenzene 5'-phosphate synthase
LIIETPSRLHITLIDLNGVYNRIDGGVGLTIEEPKLILEVEPTKRNNEIIFKKSKDLNKSRMDDYQKKIEDATTRMVKFLEIESNFKFTVIKTFPSHSGLGSGTQLALAIGKLISKIHNKELSVNKIAKIVGRGGTSGIGIVAFDNGGFIVDGGHSTSEKSNFLPSSVSKAYPPPIIARYDFPEDWNFIVAIPKISWNVSGLKEVNIFQKYCPIPLKEVQELSHLLMMKMMPSVIEHDLDSFGFAINQIQNIGFKKIESELQRPEIRKLMEEFRNAGAAGAGMSSFGPTVYAITDTNTKEISKAVQNVVELTEGTILVTKAKNNGATIEE